ncbi:sulfotransferase domain-containing protein [Thiohalorhabdus methylotrophus]|uniref:Sulfotransferase domain-containing protein n=1 Tax=Thiohalorhabdus methylotrophus TaxID=3242694 RepID=A0ABV4TUL7_9GAMM
MSFPPDVYLIGAPKAGTTTLAEILETHPEVTVSTPKEPHYFTQNWDRDLDWYRARFPAGVGGMLVDASTSYAADPLGTVAESPLSGVPERIRQVNPDARFIYVVREPVARTYSAYWHDVRLGYERLPFWEAITEDPTYLATSDYAAQLEKYLPYFDPDRFLILTAEALWKDNLEVANKCFAFMGLEAMEEASLPSLHKNKSYAYNGLGRYVFGLLNSDSNLKRASDLAKKILPDSAYKALGRALTKEIPPIRPWQRARLEELFAAKNERFRELTGVETGYKEPGDLREETAGSGANGPVREEG